MLFRVLEHHPHWEQFGLEGGALRGRLKPLPALFPEEERSKQPSAFSILRALIGEFQSELRFAAGAGGRVRLRSAVSVRSDRAQAAAPRPKGSAPVPVRRHLLHGSQEGADRALPLRFRAWAISPRAGCARTGAPAQAAAANVPTTRSRPTTRPKSTWPTWKRCAKACGRANITKWCCARRSRPTFRKAASELFQRIQHASPSPYEFLLQLGDEQLVGASPEMFVRVEGDRVETCPIAGTARRTGDPLRDADNIRDLLNSTKEESELTMCTDVDRNDKSRVCVPGSVKVIGAAADRILRGRVPYRGSRGRASCSRASIRWTRFSPTCGR